MVRLTRRPLRARFLAWSLTLTALLGLVPLHDHAIRLGDLESFQDGQRATAGLHPRAPQHVEASSFEVERSCPACLSSLQSHASPIERVGALTAPALDRDLPAHPALRLAERALASSAARGPPAA